MAAHVNICGLLPIDVAMVLYQGSKAQGLGRLAAGTPLDEVRRQAQALLARDDGYIDYLAGRVLKVQLTGESFCPAMYDRDSGEGAAAAAVAQLRASLE